MRLPDEGLAGGGQSQQQQQQQQQQTTWDELRTPGAYVELGSGDLFRVPEAAITGAGMPVIEKVSLTHSKLLRVSDNPLAPISQCRTIAANNDVTPNF